MSFYTYPFWDLIAEESFLYDNIRLREGTIAQFNIKESDKNVYVFGCNEACRLFVNEYDSNYKICGILDNSRAKIGTIYAGKEVLDVNVVVPQLDEKKDVIIIALRLNSDKIASQLDEMNFQNYYGLAKIVSGIEPYCNFVEYVEMTKCEKIEEIIMFESTNDFDGNSGAVYEYLRKNKEFRHKCVWVIKDKRNETLLLDEDDLAICPRHSEDDMRMYIYYRAKAKWQIWDNNPIRKVRPEQINVFLQHFGMGYKQVNKIYNSPDYVDYVLVPTISTYSYVKNSLLYATTSQIIYGELPRNDVLISDKWNELEKITTKEYEKVIMWAPTLRDSDLFNRVDSSREYPFGVPLIYENANMEEVNEFLCERNMLLLIKIHPRQKKNYKSVQYSNIIYIDSENVKKIHAYKLLTQVDALISDYSSIVFDYMLLDRPVAWVLEDMDDYQIPFLMEEPLDFMPGDKIYTLNQLLSFFDNIYNDVDSYKTERSKISQKFNAPFYGKGSETIVNFLQIYKIECGECEYGIKGMYS